VDDEDDLSEEGDDEEEAPTKSRPKSKRRRTVHDFIQDDVEVDDDEEGMILNQFKEIL
jgi:hypothetical protein